MSLRAQIHDAIDDVATPAPTLERRVKAFVLADNRTRSELRALPRPSWAFRFRAPIALVAVALVVVLIGGLVLGGRFWRNQNLPPSTVGINQLKSLESRPLNYPVVAPGATCPAAAPHLDPQVGMVTGNGPVYVGDFPAAVLETNDWGTWLGLAFVGTRDPGLVLVRAQDLKNSAQVAFAKYPLEPTPMVAVGPVLGSSRVANHSLQLRSEAAIPDSSKWPPPPKLGTHPELIVLLGLQKGTSGCIGMQIDAASFSDSFAMQLAVPGA